MDIEIAGQHLDHTAHQIAEIRDAMQLVALLYEECASRRIAYERARRRLRVLIEQARHD